MLRAPVALAILLGGALALSARPAAAQDEKGAFGIGLIVGEPTGISAKLYTGDTTAIDAAFGLSVIGSGLDAHADFLWHPWQLASEDSFVLPAYIGIGGRLARHDRGAGENPDFHMGIRGVFGMVFDFREIPIDVFAEVAPVVDYRTASSDHGGIAIDINAGAGARYYF